MAGEAVTRQSGDFTGLRHGRECVKPIEGAVWFGPGDALYVHIKGAGTFDLRDLPAAIEEARREWFGGPQEVVSS